jgi:polar amino acid transport system substrate-binding protein
VIGNSSFTDTAAREKQVNFVDYFQAGEGVYAKPVRPSSSPGLRVSAASRSPSRPAPPSRATPPPPPKSCPAGKKVDVIPFPTQTEANTAVRSGRAQFGFLDSQIADYVVSTSKGVFKSVGSAVNVAPYGIATPKTTAGAGLAKAIEAAVKT